jgi:hypothetical protein
MLSKNVKRKKPLLGVLKRAIAIKERRDGDVATQGSVTMKSDIDRKVMWRKRMVDTDTADIHHHTDGEDVLRKPRRVR